MEEKNEKKVPKKGKKLKVGIAIGVVAMVILGMQVYASTNGYGNVFFMIKELITTQTANGEDEIFSDKEITLSYKSIEIANGLKMQVNKLELKENESTICLNITNEIENNELLPLHYVVRAVRPYGDDGYIPVFRPEAGNVTFDGTEGKVGQYNDYINVPCKFEGNETITVDVQDKSGKSLRNIEINLETREITVTGEDEMSKISQIELKKYLSIFSQLNNGSMEDVQLVKVAWDIYDMNSTDGNQNVTLEESNQIIREFYGDKAVFETVEPAPDTRGGPLESIKLSPGSCVHPSYQANGYIIDNDINEYQIGLCLKISDIKYEDGIYTVKYIYTLYREAYVEDDEIEDQPQYETTIKLKRNENAKFSKYQIIDLENGTEVKEKVNAEVKEEKTEEIADFTEDDICGHFDIARVENTKSKVDIDKTEIFGYQNAYIYFTKDKTFGTNILADSTTGLNEHDIIGTWKISGNSIILTYPDSKEVTVKYDNTMNLHDNVSRQYGVYTIYLEKNYKWLEDAEVEEPQEETNTSTNTGNTTVEKPNYDPSKVDNYASTMNWTEYWAPGLKFKYPTDWEFSDTPRATERGLTVNAEATGWAIGKNPDTKEIIESYMTIEVYDQVILSAEDNNAAYEKFADTYGFKKVGPSYSGMTQQDGKRWICLYDIGATNLQNDVYYVNLGPFVKQEGETETRYVVNIVRLKTDNAANYKVTNISNKVIGELKTTSK